MTPEMLQILYTVGLVVGGWWLRNWTGPLATFLRGVWPKPAPTPDGTPAPVPVPSPVPNALDWLKRLIPDDPNAQWDDLARAAIDALGQRLLTAKPEAKLPLVRRVLDLIERMDEPAALAS